MSLTSLSPSTTTRSSTGSRALSLRCRCSSLASRTASTRSLSASTRTERVMWCDANAPTPSPTLPSQDVEPEPEGSPASLSHALHHRATPTPRRARLGLNRAWPIVRGPGAGVRLFGQEFGASPLCRCQHARQRDAALEHCLMSCGNRYDTREPRGFCSICGDMLGICDRWLVLDRSPLLPNLTSRGLSPKKNTSGCDV